jgi:hypothetical protein
MVAHSACAYLPQSACDKDIWPADRRDQPTPVAYLRIGRASFRLIPRNYLNNLQFARYDNLSRRLSWG